MVKNLNYNGGENMVLDLEKKEETKEEEKKEEDNRSDAEKDITAPIEESEDFNTKLD